MFYGYHMGMSRNEILNTRFGLFIDMMSCLGVFNGNSKLKKVRKVMSFEEAIELR